MKVAQVHNIGRMEALLRCMSEEVCGGDKEMTDIAQTVFRIAVTTVAALEDLSLVEAIHTVWQYCPDDVAPGAIPLLWQSVLFDVYFD